MSTNMNTIVKLVEPISKKRGLSLEVRGDAIVLRHRNAPLFIVIRPTSRGLEVGLSYENIKDYIEDIIESEEDPRDFIEGLLDELTLIAHEVENTLKRAGYETVLRVREAVMDVLDQLEEAEEGL